MVKKCKYFECTRKGYCAVDACSGRSGQAYLRCGCSVCVNHSRSDSPEGAYDICEIALCLRESEMEESGSSDQHENEVRLDLSHIKVIEYDEEIGPYRREMVALFNENKISLEDAVRLVRAGEYNDNVLWIPSRQFVALFRDGRE